MRFLNLEMESGKDQSIRIHLKAFVDGVSDNVEALSHAHFTAKVPVAHRKNKYKIALKDFSIPYWWYSLYQLETFEHPQQLLRKEFTSIDWQSGLTGKEVEETMLIKKIYFQRTRFPIFYRLLSLLRSGMPPGP